ncbi:Serine/threonine-protein kinase-transforming protein Rmil [Podospora fimiseda]|uniref:Serine/threonine-protein kinase-transforming protein Rmil n=1 Tax=Podospora fimiseda TaxID=252190 RepID=A0AAN7BJR1_9PEZI|nr:Serine/threonine-protein kinase-transforming protein Rmil [Podospora fimiseda]
MASVELVMAALGTADLCLKYGKRLVDAYRVYKSADEKLKDKILIIEAIWHKTAVQIEFVKRVAKMLQEEHCRIHFEVFEMLQGKLRTAISKIEGVLKKNDSENGPGVSLRRWKFVLIRESLDEVICEMERWQRVFDPTWLLILRVEDQGIDTELSRDVTTSSLSRSSTLVASLDDSAISKAKSLRGVIKSDSSRAQVHVSLSEDGLDWSNATVIPYSNIKIVGRLGSATFCAIDSRACGPGVDASRAKAAAEMLAKKLHEVDPKSCNLLSCQGLIKRRKANTRWLASIDLVFRLPLPSLTLDQGQSPKIFSLRQRLLHIPPSNISLTHVLNIARHLARAVSSVHTCEFVHKNIRPETILVLPDEENDSIILGSAYLLGFDSFRGVYFHTNRLGDPDWERNLYRHPQRQGLHVNDAYIMQHDLYSLGVCLLELGLWTSFLEYQDGDDKVVPSAALGLMLQDFEYSEKSAAKIKDHLVQIAKSRLPARMGDRYTAVVVTCLTCLDPGNDDFGDPDYMTDEDGILIGVRFIEKVLVQLGNISF